MRGFSKKFLCFTIALVLAVLPGANSFALSATQLDIFSQNNILFYDPCGNKGGRRGVNVSSDSCFRINDSVSATDFWYAEGCLDNGTCTSGKYAGGRGGTQLVMTSNNPFLYDDTMTDDDFGGMQYIYAENYNYDYSGAYTKMTPNGGNSTRKYYWIVLPAEAYTNGLGDTYVATFENMSEPVYFIVFDAHACQHQSEDYCGKARDDPNAVAIGKEFLGAFTKNGGSYSSVAGMTGRLTSLCRINGTGEVTASESADNSTEIIDVSFTPSSNDDCPGDNFYDDDISEGGLTEDLAWRIAHYYNLSGEYSPINGYGLRNCVELVIFFINELTTKGRLDGLPNGGEVARRLAGYWGEPLGTTPRVWSVFSSDSHTGVIVGANGDGTYVTIEAAYPGWDDGFSEGPGNARVYARKSFNSSVYTFAYFGSGSVRGDRMNEILNAGY